MFEKDLVLYNPQIESEPLILEFEENVFIGNKDQIICKITLEQAYQMLEHSYGEYLENNIYIPDINFINLVFWTNESEYIAHIFNDYAKNKCE